MELALKVAPLIVVLVFVLVTAVIDMWKFKIHNVITFPLLLTGVAYHGIVGVVYHGVVPGISPGTQAVAASLLGALFGIVAVGVFYCMGGMGAGDVKLMGAIGAWLCLPLTFLVFVASALACGVYALILIVGSGRFRETWVNLKVIYYRMAAVGRHLSAEDNVEVAVAQSDRRARVIPFAAMVAVGMLSLLVIAWCVSL